jgi:cholera toxin transcriptional activator
MTTNNLPPQAAPETPPALLIRTGWADCLAHFQPAVYQLLLHKPGGDEKVDLGFSGSRLLERLLRCPGEVVARDELLAYAWSDRVVGQGSLNQQVYTLRQVLGDEKSREIIQTLPRRGYMFNPIFLAPLPVAADQPASDDDAQNPPATVPLSPRQRRLYGLLSGAGALALLGVALLAFINYSLFQSQVLVHRQQIGALQLTYANPNAANLQELIEETTALGERLAGLATRPAQVRLGKTSGFYELLCTHQDGSSHWLMIHQQQLANVTDQQLQGCLP